MALFYEDLICGDSGADDVHACRKSDRGTAVDVKIDLAYALDSVDSGFAVSGKQQCVSLYGGCDLIGIDRAYGRSSGKYFEIY